MVVLRLRLAVFAAAVCFFLPFAAPVQAAPLVREPGAIYLEDVLPKPLKINVTAEGPIYFDAGFTRYLGVLKGGQLVELQAVLDNAYRVKGQAHQGQVVGWIEPKYLGALKPDFLANLKLAARRAEEVKALIAKKEAAINMTPEEVQASLGKAGKVSSRVDAAGRHDVWEYIRYEVVPQQVNGGLDRFGNPVVNTIYVKVPIGKLAVIFDNNLVTALEQNENNLGKDSQVKIIAAPINVY